MQSPELARDYILRAGIRLKALDVLYEAGSWADVVRESQEVIELALKALLRASGIDPPRVPDVSPVLLAERARIPGALHPELSSLAEASRQLRRDRELAFYGAADLTPSGFYREEDARQARESARRTVTLVSPHISSWAEPHAAVLPPAWTVQSRLSRRLTPGSLDFLACLPSKATSNFAVGSVRPFALPVPVMSDQ